MDHVTKEQLSIDYQTVRHCTEVLCQPLVTEDYVIQSIEDVSPPKWHLAHTTWFFETFILMPFLPAYTPFNSQFHYLFNSYYQRIGKPYPRAARGLLARPTVEMIYHYRHVVDEVLLNFLAGLQENDFQKIAPLVTLGLHHEQQHQELLMMDIKHNLSLHPDFPAYIMPQEKSKNEVVEKMQWVEVEGGMVNIGHDDNEFCFDNELPFHQQFIQPYAISNRLVTNGEYLAFMNAGGYHNSEWWLADGWENIQKNNWRAPLYWHEIDNKWYVYTLRGLSELNLAEPVSHVSYYEADAYARWNEKRLPKEAEWEHFVRRDQKNSSGNFLETNHFHPKPFEKSKSVASQFFGDTWEWTASAYMPYPGYKMRGDALGEYNGKFMNNQIVLRGGCCVTPASHVRASYRNFFQPEKRWQFSGIRLAQDLKGLLI